MARPRRCTRSLASTVALALASGCNAVPAQVIGQAAAASAVLAGTVESVAEVTATTGPTGLAGPALARGTYYGKGARLESGTRVETPVGTLAELALGPGRRLRLNERAALTLGAADAVSTLHGGEIVALVDARVGPALELELAGDRVRIDDGEVQLVHAGEQHHVAVVHGRATVTSGGTRIELGAGERVTTPLPLQAPLAELSLRALGETAWSRSFEQASAMAEAVPRGVGSLTARQPGTRGEKPERVRLADQRVTVDISGRLARTEIEQSFANDRAAVLEGIYRFPLPGDASIAGLQLLVGNRWMDGEIVEKQRGREIFQHIVDATVPRDPALLEWERANLFKLRLFPIPARGERRVRLSYTQVLPVVGDAVQYRFPLGGSGTRGPAIDHFAFTVHVDRTKVDLAGLDRVATPMLALDRSEDGDTVTFHAEQSGFQPSYDLGLDLPLAKDDRRVHADTHLDRDGQAYFMLALQPQLQLAADDRPLHFAFVLDRSHSTTPELWTAARGLVEALSSGLDAGDRFTVLACDAACDELPSGVQAPSTAALESVRRFLDEQDLAGASDIGAMVLEAGAALTRTGSVDARRVVVYLGDGAPSSGALAPDELAQEIRDGAPGLTVSAIALGARVDEAALAAVVEATGGDLVRVGAHDDLDALVHELRLRARVAQASNVRIETPAGMVAVHHDAGDGLRPGEGVVVTGKLEHPVRGEVHLLADGPSGPIDERFRVDVSPVASGGAAQNRHLPRTWAQMEIAALTRREGAAASARIVALSKDYTVLSRFTSLLVLESDAMYREFDVERTTDRTDAWDGAVDVPPERVTAPLHAAGVVAPSAQQRGEAGGIGSSPPAAAPHQSEAKTEAPPLPVEVPPVPDAAPPFADAAPTVLEAREDDAPGLGGFAGAGDELAPMQPGGFDAPAARGFGRKGRRGRAKSPEPATRFAPPPARPRPLVPPRGPANADGEIASRDRWSEPTPAPEPWAGAEPSPPPPTTIAPVPPAGGWGTAVPSEPPLRRRAPRLRVATIPAGARAPSIEALRRAVQAEPTRRSAHGALVRAALRGGHADALPAARAWAEADPEHAPALLALADALAAQGDPLAARAYASAVELAPFVGKEHATLARGFELAGDLRRACSHRRAQVSIDPRDVEARAQLSACLARRGEPVAARAQLDRARADARGPLAAIAVAQAVLAGEPAAVVLPRRGQLRATLRWRGEDDLDVAVVDRQGRRRSARHPLGVAVAEGPGLDRLVLPRVAGSVIVEVTRSHALDDEDLPPVAAELELRVGGRTRVVPVVLTRGSARVARVFWDG